MGGGSGEGGKKAVVLSGHTKKWCLIHFAVELLKGVLPKAVIRLYLNQTQIYLGSFTFRRYIFMSVGGGGRPKTGEYQNPVRY